MRDFPRLLASVEASLGQIRTWYESIDLPPEVRDAIDQWLASAGQGASGIDFGALLPIARTILGTAAGFFAFLIIPIWAFYILRDRVHLTDSFADALPHEWRDEVWAVLSIIERVIGRGSRAHPDCSALVCGRGHLPRPAAARRDDDPRFTQFAVLLAVIAGIFELLPIIGPILSMVPTLLVALTTPEPVVAAIAVVLLYLVVQQVEGAVLVPKIQGSAVELHPSLVIFVLIIGGATAGLLGAILAIPINCRWARTSTATCSGACPTLRPRAEDSASAPAPLPRATDRGRRRRRVIRGAVRPHTTFDSPAQGRYYERSLSAGPLLSSAAPSRWALLPSPFVPAVIPSPRR